MTADPVDEIRALVAAHPFAPRRSFRRAGFDVTPQFVTDQMEVLTDPERRVIVRDGARIVAVVGTSPRDFESQIVGFRSVGSTPVFTHPDVDRVAATAEVLKVLRIARAESGDDLIVLQVDTEDGDALAGAQLSNFTVCDTSTAWVIAPDAPTDDLEVSGYRVEVLDGESAARLPVEATAALIDEAGRAFVHTHLHADPRIPNDRADEVYRRWAENTIHGRWYDYIITVWRNDEVVGVLGWRRKSQQAVEGEASILTDSFGWRLPSAEGVGKAFHRCVVGAFDADIIEGVTQLSNPLIYVLARGGHFKAILSHYSMHGWCG